MVVHAYNPTTGEADTKSISSLKPAWDTMSFRPAESADYDPALKNYKIKQIQCQTRRVILDINFIP